MDAFIGQGFSTDSESAGQLLDDPEISSIGDAVEASLADSRFNRAVAAVAFATEKGVQHLKAMVQSGSVDDVEVYVGVDEKVTTKDALEGILESGLSGFIYHAGSTYHPKLFYFDGPERVRVLVGSGNLTQDGLYTNYEAAFLAEVDKNADAVADLEQYLEQIERHGNTLSDDLISDLVDDGKVNTEAEQRQQRAAESNSTEGASGEGSPSYKADVPRQSAPSLSSSGSSGRSTPSEESSEGTHKLESLDEYQLEREEMPDIPPVRTFPTETDRDYYKQLISENDNQVNFMRRIIREEGRIRKGELKDILREQLDVNISGSFDADLRVLWRTTDEVRREGRGDDQMLIWTGE